MTTPNNEFSNPVSSHISLKSIDESTDPARHPRGHPTDQPTGGRDTAGGTTISHEEIPHHDYQKKYRKCKQKAKQLLREKKAKLEETEKMLQENCNL